MRSSVVYSTLAVCAVALLALAWRGSGGQLPVVGLQGTIKVGVLHSLTGTMATSESRVAESTQLAIDEINGQGGVLGRRIEALVRDGASSNTTFAREAQALIADDGVAVVFGCWTSACRKTVRPIFEQHDHLLFYPLQYEGLEHSPNIVYTGAAPNQQILPAVKWALDNLGRRFVLVGSDYVFPHAAHAIMRDQIRSLDGKVLGEFYVLLGSDRVQEAVDLIVKTRPDAILNTLNGDSNVAFFKALRARGIQPADIPTISFSVAEAELKAMGSAQFAGDYAAWNYFQSVPGEINQRFVRAYQARYGADAVVTDPMESAYAGVHLWASAVQKAGSAAPQEVRKALGAISVSAPQGAVTVDPQTQHVWKSVRIGQIRPDGQFDIVWSTAKPVRPQPFPPYRTPEEWNGLLNTLYAQWQGQWSNPEATATPARLAP